MATNEVLQLQHQHMFGSAEQWVDTLITHKQVAPIHAVIFFKDNCWQLECLAPTCHFKIFHNNKRLLQSRVVKLEIGAIISFTPDGQNWRLINLDRPRYFIHAVHTQDLFIELRQPLKLPVTGKKQLSIEPAHNNQWYCNKGQDSYPLKEGSLLSFENEIWRFTTALPANFAYNPIPTEQNNQQLIVWIYVSKDEEHVNIQIDFNSQRYDLGERAHHYLLLLLARARKRDIAAGYDQQTQGWIDVEEITSQLKIEPNVFNMQVTRIRRQFEKFQHQIPPLSSGVIQRRTKQLRFGFSDFKIFRGSELEDN